MQHPRLSFILLTSIAVSSWAQTESSRLGGLDQSSLHPTWVVESAQLNPLDALIPRLCDRQVVFIGEQHDRYEDHLTQAAIIQGLQHCGRPLAIGMEMFQQPYQEALDDYRAGRIDESELLRRTEYFDRWRFDYRLYRPILALARAHGIPLIALNLSAELTRKVGDRGIAGLSPEERVQLPEIDRSDPDYRARLQEVFQRHPAEQQRNFEHFFEVQLLWDEGMAERAARYLAEHPDHLMVVLSGSGHLEFGQGIPKRLARRLPVRMAILLNGSERRLDPGVADLFFYPPSIALPSAGKLGVQLADRPDSKGGMVIQGLTEDSGAQAAGLKAGDRLLRIDGQLIRDYTDVRLALLDARPGQRVQVDLARSALLGADEYLTLEVELR